MTIKHVKSQQPNNTLFSQTRRLALKKMLMGTGVAAGAATLPGKWVKPMVDKVMVPAHAQTSLQTLNVRVEIDGRSVLVIEGNQVWWDHFENNAPGTSTVAYPPGSPTVLNGTDWTPTWPNPGTNDSCGCSSSRYTGIPRLAAQDQTVTVIIIVSRESTMIIQQPNAGNGYQFRLEFDDTSTGGWTDYEVTITYF